MPSLQDSDVDALMSKYPAVGATKVISVASIDMSELAPTTWIGFDGVHGNGKQKFDRTYEAPADVLCR